MSAKDRLRRFFGKGRDLSPRSLPALRGVLGVNALPPETWITLS